jgi:hypothetical protein
MSRLSVYLSSSWRIHHERMASLVICLSSRAMEVAGESIFLPILLAQTWRIRHVEGEPIALGLEVRSKIGSITIRHAVGQSGLALSGIPGSLAAIRFRKVYPQ